MKYLRKIYLIIRFILFYLSGLVEANFRIAIDILSPKLKIKPGIVSIELDAKTDQEILSLINLISMTPGSLCIDISEDKKHLYVHEMYLEDIENYKISVKQNLEKRILEIFR